MDTTDKIKSMAFLNEPLWRWVLAIGAFLLIIGAWKGVLEYVKGAA